MVDTGDVISSYRLIERLGEGGMGAVFLGYREDIHRKAAIKVLRADLRGADHIERFLREARAANIARHPNIVEIHDFGVTPDGCAYLIMEYLDGLSLAEVISRTGPMPVRRAGLILTRIAAGLGAAHQQGVVHRDLKPQNVFLVPDSNHRGEDSVKILDFGIAKVREVQEGARITRTDTVLGTPTYMSPEQCASAPEVDARSDVYSLGVIAYEMLAGRPPFVGASLMHIIVQHLSELPQPLSLHAPMVPKALEEAVHRALAKQPGERFPTARAFGSAVWRAIEETGESPLGGDTREVALPPHDRLVGAGVGAAREEDDDPSTSSTIVETRRRRTVVNLADVERLPDGWTPAIEAAGFDPRPSGERSAASEDTEDTEVIEVVKLRPTESCRAWELDHPTTGTRTLFCVDAAVGTTDLVVADLVDRQLLIADPTLPPGPLLTALRWMSSSRPSALGAFVGDRPLTLERVAIPDATRKSSCVDDLLADAARRGASRRTLRALGELADEMIMNALLHAPWRRDAHPEPRAGERADGRASGAPVLEWTSDETSIAIAVRDTHGSLAPTDILSRLASPEWKPSVDSRKAGAGMGIRIMCKAADSIFFLLRPGRSCEVLAVLAKAPATGAREPRVLGILHDQDLGVTAAGDRLKVLVRQEPSTAIRLIGEINETSDLRSIYRGAGPVVVDLSGVTRINSGGLRAWLEASVGRSPRHKLVLQACSPAMVSQINMVSFFLDTAEIESILCPYSCPTCDAHSLSLVTLEELAAQPVPVRTCATCHAALVLDEYAPDYFAFAEAMPARGSG